MRRLIVLGLAISGFIGCSGGDSPAPGAKQQSVAASTKQTKQTKHAATRAAHEFLSAMIAGDTATATNRLTPRAIAQFESTGQRFAPPGLESASFEVGEIRQPAEDVALVQCVLKNSGGESGVSEEMCCVMRLIAGEWRVSGIAYDAGANSPPVILDFENINAPPVNPQNFAEKPETRAATPKTAHSPHATQTR